MSIAINYEEVAKDLAIKVANLELQLSTYKNVLSQLEKDHAEAPRQTYPETPTVSTTPLKEDDDG